MRLLHLALSTLGYGETLIGVSLADQLRAADVESHFVVTERGRGVLASSGHGHTVIDPAMGRLARLIVDDVVADFAPDALVLDDYFTFCGVLEDHFGLDPWFVEEYGRPILPIDIWEWENTDFTIDCAPGRGFDVSKRILDFDAHLRPVPVAHVDPAGSARGFPYRLWPRPPRRSDRNRDALRTQLGVSARDRLVVLTLAQWQRGRTGSTLVADLLTSYLNELDDRVHYVLVGAGADDFAALPAERTHRLPQCGPDPFGELLGAADLMVTLNVGSTSLARAVLAGLDAVVISNSATVLDPPLYPFRMWPMGAHDFLEPLLRANPYTDAFVSAQLLDADAVVNALEATLHDAPTRQRLAEARTGYQATVATLPPTCEVFDQAARLAGLTL